MESELLLTITSFVFFLILSGFFSSSETALTALGKAKARNLADSDAKNADLLLPLVENPRRTLTGILIGNNIANVAASALATAVALDSLKVMGVQNIAVALTIITFIMTVLVLIFGEITPKSMVLKDPERWALRYSRPLTVVLFIFKPLVSVFHMITLLITRLFGMSSETAGKFLTADELKTLVTMGQEEGVIDKEEQEMIHSIMEFSDTVVREIMTPRTDAVCIEVSSTVSDAIMLISDKGHSRIPVYEEKIDNIIGVIYAKDLLTVDGDSHRKTLHKFYRPPIFIPEVKSIEALFQQMKRSRFHMAIIVDEHGGFSGLATLEDIIEEIIGEIRDEYDKDENPECLSIGNDQYLVDAKMNIDDFASTMSVEIPETDDYDTVGGFVLSLFGRLPASGEKRTYKSLDIMVKSIKKQRILTVEVTCYPEVEDTSVESD